jgi:hypothetical protein
MKNLLFLSSLLLVSWVSWGQNDSILTYPVNNEGKIEYKEVIEVSNTNKNNIHKKVKTWFGKTFNSAGSVIQTETEDNITAKAALPIKIEYGKQSIFTNWYYILSIDLKDNKCRIIANPIEAQTWQNTSKEEYDKLSPKIRANTIKSNNSYVNQHNEYFKKLFSEFKDYILEKDDW